MSQYEQNLKKAIKDSLTQGKSEYLIEIEKEERKRKEKEGYQEKLKLTKGDCKHPTTKKLIMEALDTLNVKYSKSSHKLDLCILLRNTLDKIIHEL